jgi:parallel beta-helix repeat protein
LRDSNKFPILIRLESRNGEGLMRLVYLIVLGVLTLSAAAQNAESKTWTVNPGQSIQAKIDKAAPGDTIQILPGVYNQSVSIATEGITLRGLEYEGEYAVLNGENEGGARLDTAIAVNASNVRLENLRIDNFVRSGINAESSDGLHILGARIADTGATGIAVSGSRDVEIENCIVRDATHAGIALTNSVETRVATSEVYSNRVGIHVLDGLQLTLVDVSAHHNRTGILLVNGGGEEADSEYVTISHSRIVGNGIVPAKEDANDTPPNSVLEGIGIHIQGFDHVEVSHCYVDSNGTYGILVEKSRDDHSADFSYVHHNHYQGNGVRPNKVFNKRYPRIPPGDIYWDGQGERNQFQETGELQTWPEDLVVKQGGVHTEVIHFL